MDSAAERMDNQQVHCSKCQQDYPTAADRMAEGDWAELAALAALNDVLWHATGGCIQ